MQNAGGLLTEELQNLLKIESECATLQTQMGTSYANASAAGDVTVPVPTSSQWADQSAPELHATTDSASVSASATPIHTTDATTIG